MGLGSLELGGSSFSLGLRCLQNGKISVKMAENEKKKREGTLVFETFKCEEGVPSHFPFLTNIL